MTLTRPISVSAALGRFLALALSLVAASSQLPAQTAPSAATPAAKPASADKETLILMPFQVSTTKDRGYFGGNTLAGGRADTPLKITPASISVMTKEFLEDFNLTDMNQAAAWTVGMDSAQGGEAGAFGGNRFQSSFRGVDGNGNFPVRNGSINYYVADSYNSERYDFSRGPNAALFGDGGPGGLQGSTSKVARLNSIFSSATFRVDSFAGYRTTFDTNYGNDRVAVRLNLLRQDTKAYQDGTSSRQNGMTVAGTYKISDNTQFRFDIQRDGEKNVAYLPRYTEQASRWDRTTVNENNSAIVTPNNYGLAQLSPTNDYLVWNFGTNSLLNYKGNQYSSIGLGYDIPWGGRPDLPNFKAGVDKKFNLGPADSYIDRNFSGENYWLEHKFSSDFYVQLGIVKNQGAPYYVNSDSLPSEYRLDLNRLLPTGAANPNFGKAYADFQQHYQIQRDMVREYKVAATYKFEAPGLLGMKQRFNLNAGWRRTTFELRNSAWRWNNNPASTGVPSEALNSLRYRVYWDQPRPSIGPVTPPSVPGIDWRLVEYGGNINMRTINYAQLVSQTTFLDERVAITASLRRDKVEGDFVNVIGSDPVTYKAIYGFANSSGVNTAGLHRLRKLYKSSPSAGLVTYPFAGKNRFLAPLGFVANFSSNFSQIANANIPLITGKDPDLTFARTYDFGLRYAVGDGIAYMTLTHYNTKQENQLSTWGNRGDFQSLYRNLGYTDPNLISSTGFNYQDQAARKLEGWEAEITANPTKNISFVVNYSKPLVYAIYESRDRRVFYAANLAEYQAGAAATAGQVIGGRTIIDPAAIQQAMLNIENSFNGAAPGTLQNGLHKYRVNVAGTYRFTDGKLKGLGFNAGVNYRAERKVGSRDPRLKFQIPGTATVTPQQNLDAAFDYLYVDPTWSAVAGANYTRRFGKVQARFQINITNLFNDQSPQWGTNGISPNAYSVITAGQLQNLPGSATNNGNALTVAGGNPRMQVLSNFTQLEPRKISFTTTLSF